MRVPGIAMRSGWQVDGMTGEIFHVAAAAVREVAAKMGWCVERRADGSLVALATAEIAGPIEIEDGLIVSAA